MDENKMENLQKAGHISNLTWRVRYFISSNFSMNWGKWHFEGIENFAHTKVFLSLGKALLLLLPLYLQMITAQISVQTDNH